MQPEQSCRYFGKQITSAAFGDSHVVEPAYALAEQLRTYDQGLLHFSFSACSPALLVDVKNRGCHEWVQHAVRYLEQDSSIKNVLLAFRHPFYLYGDQE